MTQGSETLPPRQARIVLRLVAYRKELYANRALIDNRDSNGVTCREMVAT